MYVPLMDFIFRFTNNGLCSSEYSKSLTFLAFIP